VHSVGAAYLAVNLAREIHGGDVVFTGVSSSFPAAACLLAKRAYPFSFTYINVAGGVDPELDRLPRSSGDPALLHGTAAIFGNEDFYDLTLRGGMDVVFLGAAQIDAQGRTNVSAIGAWHDPKVRLPGGGGAATMMPTARRTVVWQTAHSTRGLVEKLDFVTAAGAAVLITPLAVFRKMGGRFALESHRADYSIDELRDRTGFTFDVSTTRPTAPGTEAELAALAVLDPDRLLDLELGQPPRAGSSA
jgi:glutaconate CoA-transferase subunit B